jgi:tRNA-2-methylthio-N6-dimethylallyladenosine synthase
MFDDVPYEEKLSRLNRLQALINVNANKISQSMIGTEQNVLVEKQSKKDIGQISGRTENNRWVNFDGPEDLIGSFVNLTITEALPNSLRARLIN